MQRQKLDGMREDLGAFNPAMVTLFTESKQRTNVSRFHRMSRFFLRKGKQNDGKKRKGKESIPKKRI